VVERPRSAEQAAEALRAAAEAGRRVRVVGAGSRRGWGNPVVAPDVELSTEALNAVIEHNAGDLTAVLAAGAPLSGAQRVFADAGQMLALDPPDDPGATVGGLVATADSGPLRHRHGGVRDLILGATVALPDGSLAHAGGKVIKNVAGYDLAKLQCGAFGTLGVIVEAVFRLHPTPAQTASVVGEASSPGALAAAAARLAQAPLELQCLDVRWEPGRGAVLARAGGSAARRSADAAAKLAKEAGLDVSLEHDDERLWNEQRRAQRAPADGTLLRVSGRATQLADVLDAADAEGGRVVGRAALGLSWIALPVEEPAGAIAAVQRVRAKLAPSPCVVLDAPGEVRAALDPWDLADGPELALMRRLKARFDPQNTCNPGIFVGGI
jgi:glycolate oxidase FAD binding subunit